LNLRPSGYEPDELPGCSTPRPFCCRVRLGFFLAFRVFLAGPSGAVGRGPVGAAAAPVGVPRLRGSGGIVRREVSFLVRSGGDLLSHVLRRSTIGATALNGRVRDGIGCFARAMATRPDQKRAAVAGPSHCLRGSGVLPPYISREDPLAAAAVGDHRGLFQVIGCF
jgi:hypothetical protein